MKTLIALAASLLAIGAANAEPLKLRIHWATVPGHWAPMNAKVGAEVQPHYGKSYVVEPIFIAGSGPALQALAANELDLSGLSPQVISAGINEAKLDLKVIGQQLSTDVPGFGGSGFWVRKDEIKKVEDLKGKTIGVNARGSTIDAAARTMLSRHGMEDGKDYQVVELRFPAQLAALQSKRIDLAILLRPFDEQAGKDPSLKQLFTMGDAIGPTETVSWVGKADFIAKNRAVLVDFLEDNIRLRRWASGAGHDKAVKTLAELVKKSPEEMNYAFTKGDNYYDPDAKVNTARMQKNIDDLVKIKLVNATIDTKKVVDNSIAEEAAKRVGPLTN
jgi:ABC-type nitrate/sulfonate/bicarbonate transport system substrate-binding protein